MRHLLAVVLALASGVIGCCCFPGTTLDSTEVNAARRATHEKTAGEVILLDVALLERPRGDGFLNHELWDLGNEQCVDLESKPILEENGLRVGQIGGLLPARLQALLSSPRSCPDPRRLRAEPELPTPVALGPVRERITFHRHDSSTSRSIELRSAQCFLEVTPTLEAEKRVRLRFLPRIRHGKARLEPRVARDPDGPLRWSVEAKEPIEDFPHLGWEVLVGPDDYVLVGTRLDRPDTLGSCYFLDSGGLTQKLLVLRALVLTEQTIDESLNQAPPLAMQATWTARGSGP